MKAGVLSIAALSAVVAAQPQHGAHRHRHAKKEADVAYVTEVATVTAPAKMVWVDQNGQTISADNPFYTPPPAAPAAYANNDNNNAVQKNQEQAPPAYEAPSATYEAPASSSVAPAPSSSKVEQQASPASSPASYSSPSSDSSSSSGSEYGITYSPYNSDNSCKSADQISQDLATIDGYGMIRMYGTDCDQAGPIIKAAKSKNWKVFAGLFDITDVEGQVATLKSAVEANGDWSMIDTVSVGNEGINNGQYSVDDVRAAVNSAKGCLPSEYKGDVVTVDTFIAIINNPELCGVGDYTAANCHAFFDGGVTAEKSGKWVLEQAQRVSEACGDKNRKVVITEAGWPSSGSTNGKAVPSSENQKAAVEDLKDSFSSNLILFTAFNDYWKQNTAATFGVEQYWGIYGDCPSAH